MFGRLKEQPSPQSLVGASTAPSAPEAAAGEGPPEAIILLLFVALTLAASAFVIGKSEHNAVHDPAQQAARGEVSGLSQLSLLREPNLRKALAKATAGSKNLVISIAVRPTRLDLTVRDRDGYRKYRHVDPAFKLTEDDDDVGEDNAVAAAKIDASAPERMVRAVAERTRQPATDVDYVTMSFSGSPPYSWYMSLDKGPARVRQWVAAPDGSDLRKPGEPSRQQREADARREREFKRQQRRFKRRSACFSKAQTPQALERCYRRFAP